MAPPTLSGFFLSDLDKPTHPSHHVVLPGSAGDGGMDARAAQTDSVTKKWMADLQSHGEALKPLGAQAVPRTKHPLYGSGEGLASIKPDAVVQGSVNDCFFFAPLAAVASANPALIRDAIKSNKDGSFDVTFPGAKDKPVHVAALTEHELSNYGHETANGTWPAVMEKAFATYLSENSEARKAILGHDDPSVVSRFFNWLTSNDSSDVQKTLDKGKVPEVFKLLTGYLPGGVPLHEGHSVEGAKSVLNEAFSGEKILPVVAGIDAQNKDAPKFGLLNDHDYTVLGFKNGIVTIRDPHGQTEYGGPIGDVKAGVFSMPVSDFARCFDEVIVDRMVPLFDTGALYIGNFSHLKDVIDHAKK